MPARQVRVDVHDSDTGKWTSHRLSFAGLLALLQGAMLRPAALTACLGDGRRCLALATEPGPGGAFTGHHGVTDPAGVFVGVLTYRGLTLPDVRRVLVAFYSGRAAAKCFTGRQGEFVPDEPKPLHARQHDRPL